TVRNQTAHFEMLVTAERFQVPRHQQLVLDDQYAWRWLLRTSCRRLFHHDERLVALRHSLILRRLHTSPIAPGRGTSAGATHGRGVGKRPRGRAPVAADRRRGWNP